MRWAVMLAAFAAFAAFAACGGGAGIEPDAMPGPDARLGPPPVDASPPGDARQNCPVPTTFVAPSSTGATAVKDAAGSITLALDLDATAAPDRFQMKLFAGRGVFIDGPVAGTFGINSAQLNNKSCALCLLVIADNAETYFATGGIVQLDSVSGQLKGKLTDIRFEHVSIAADPPQASTPIHDGCLTRISSLTFDVAIAP